MHPTNRFRAYRYSSSLPHIRLLSGVNEIFAVLECEAGLSVFKVTGVVGQTVGPISKCKGTA